jgi:hypothetical protein
MTVYDTARKGGMLSSMLTAAMCNHGQMDGWSNH